MYLFIQNFNCILDENRYGHALTNKLVRICIIFNIFSAVIEVDIELYISKHYVHTSSCSWFNFFFTKVAGNLLRTFV